MTKQDQAWKRLIAHHLKTEVPDGSDAWPRLAEELRLRRLAAGSETEHGQPPRRWVKFVRSLPRLTAALGAIALIVATFLPPGDAPATDLTPTRPSPARLPAIQPLHTAVRHSTLEVYDGTAVLRYEETEWYSASGLYRGNTVAQPGTSGSTTVVVDGLNVWSESDGLVTVTPYRPGTSHYMPEWVEAIEQYRLLYAGKDRCRRTENLGTETVAGRQAHVIALGPNMCGESSGTVQTLWLDTETFVPLKQEVTAADSGAKLYRREVQEFAVNGSIDLSIFAYTPPADAVLIDQSAARGPSAYVLQLLLQRQSKRAGHRLFVPEHLGDLDYVPQWPHFSESGTTVVYVPEEDTGPPRWPLERGLAFVQRPAVRASAGESDAVVPFGLELCGDGTTLEWTMGGTLITLCSRNLPESALLAFADSLVPADGGTRQVITQDSHLLVSGFLYAPDAPGFALYVPSRVPEGLSPLHAVRPTGSASVHLMYLTPDYRVGLVVVMRPKGTGFDAVPGHEGRAVSIRGGLTGHVLELSVADGDPVLWWVEGGTHISLSGRDLDWEQLVDIAESMVLVPVIHNGD